jgi:hypothetical protein
VCKVRLQLRPARSPAAGDPNRHNDSLTGFDEVLGLNAVVLECLQDLLVGPEKPFGPERAEREGGPGALPVPGTRSRVRESESTGVCEFGVRSEQGRDALEVACLIELVARGGRSPRSPPDIAYSDSPAASRALLARSTS